MESLIMERFGREGDTIFQEFISWEKERAYLKLSKNMQVLWENRFPLKKKNYYFCKNDYDDRSIVVKKKKEKSISKMHRVPKGSFKFVRKSGVWFGSSPDIRELISNEVCSTDNGNNAPPPTRPDSDNILTTSKVWRKLSKSRLNHGKITSYGVISCDSIS